MDHLNAEKILQKRAHDDPKFTFYLNHEVLSIDGEQTVQSVTVKDRATGDEKTLKANGVFIWIGLVPNTYFVKNSITLNDWDYIITNTEMETSIPGVYAAGDVCEKSVRQISTAVGDATIAAMSALKYIESM
jgi:thioredoxin reductase (NADPH)